MSQLSKMKKIENCACTFLLKWQLNCMENFGETGGLIFNLLILLDIFIGSLSLKSLTICSYKVTD